MTLAFFIFVFLYFVFVALRRSVSTGMYPLQSWIKFVVLLSVTLEASNYAGCCGVWIRFDPQLSHEPKVFPRLPSCEGFFIIKTLTS